MIRVLISAREEIWDEYEALLKAAISRAGVEAELVRECAPETVDYIVFAPNGPVSDLRPFTKLKAVLSLWAGVEDFVNNPTLTQPLARMVDPGLAEGMAEWVAGHVLRHHLGIDADIRNDARVWAPRVPPLARERKVGILGMGELGRASASALLGLGFQVTGWARRAQPEAPVLVETGEEGLARVLGGSDFLVLLLPLTGATEGLLNGERLASVKPGLVILNPGRGALIDDEALLAALDRGQISHATLDVFREEPLPRRHPFWDHARVTVTPHIASATRAVTASQVIAENIRRGKAGEAFLHLVDRDAGY